MVIEGGSVTGQAKGGRRFLILALITIVFAISSGDRATLSVAAPTISKDLHLSPVQMGWLFSSFAWAYVLFQIPAGRMVDRVGTKYGTLTGLVAWSVVTWLMGVLPQIAAPFATLLLLRVLLGVFEAPVGPACGRVLAAWFPASERGAAGAIFNSAQYVALAVFTPLMGWLSHAFGWSYIFFVKGGLGLVVSLVWQASFHVPSRHPKVGADELRHIRDGGGLTDLDAAVSGGDAGVAAASPRQRPGAIAGLFKSRMLVGIFVAQYCVNAITWFFVSWFPSYLVEGRGLSILQAGFVAVLPALAGCVGGILAGFFSDWLLRRTHSLSIARKVPITIGLALSAVMIGCNYAQTDVAVVTFMCIAFFGKGFGSLGWTVVADTAPQEIIGVTGGVFNAMGNASGIITPVVIGYILATTGSYSGALVYVGLHGVVAVLSYWLIVGKIERLQLSDEPVGRPLHVSPAKG